MKKKITILFISTLVISSFIFHITFGMENPNNNEFMLSFDKIFAQEKNAKTETYLGALQNFANILYWQSQCSQVLDTFLNTYNSFDQAKKERMENTPSYSFKKDIFVHHLTINSPKTISFILKYGLDLFCPKGGSQSIDSYPDTYNDQKTMLKTIAKFKSDKSEEIQYLGKILENNYKIFCLKKQSDYSGKKASDFMDKIGNFPLKFQKEFENFDFCLVTILESWTKLKKDTNKDEDQFRANACEAIKKYNGQKKSLEEYYKQTVHEITEILAKNRKAHLRGYNKIYGTTTENLPQSLELDPFEKAQPNTQSELTSNNSGPEEQKENKQEKQVKSKSNKKKKANRIQQLPKKSSEVKQKPQVISKNEEAKDIVKKTGFGNTQENLEENKQLQLLATKKTLSKKEKQEEQKQPINSQAIKQSIKPTEVADDGSFVTKETEECISINDPKNNVTMELFKTDKPDQIKGTINLKYSKNITNWFENPQQALEDQGYTDKNSEKFTATEEKLHKATTVHNFAKTVDRFIQKWGKQGTTPSRKKEQNDILITIPGAVYFDNGEHKTGLFVYIFDAETRICYHRGFNARQGIILLNTYFKKGHYDYDDVVAEENKTI